MDDALDIFRPLTAGECEIAPIAETPSDDGELVSPIPDDAPSKPMAHHVFGKPTAGWTYRDASGAVLFEIWRFDPAGERKQFLPLTLWRDATRLRWRWKGVLAPRPLYGLDRLAARPAAPVVVCEGEKSADAASLIFPNSVCVSSSGGSQAASKGDWSPLKGRRILLWPDADQPGAKYAAEVALILGGQGCDVSIIDAPALASFSPDGSERGPKAGFDAADAVGEWGDLADLRKAALKLAKPFDPGPAFVSWGEFTMTAEGLTRPRTHKEDSLFRRILIQAPWRSLHDDAPL
jgi:putative DNA primase/helicase